MNKNIRRELPKYLAKNYEYSKYVKTTFATLCFTIRLGKCKYKYVFSAF